MDFAAPLVEYDGHPHLAEGVVLVELLPRSAEPNSQIFRGPPEVDEHRELTETGRCAVELQVEFCPVRPSS